MLPKWSSTERQKENSNKSYSKMVNKFQMFHEVKNKNITVSPLQFHPLSIFNICQLTVALNSFGISNVTFLLKDQ